MLKFTRRHWFTLIAGFFTGAAARGLTRPKPVVPAEAACPVASEGLVFCAPGRLYVGFRKDGGWQSYRGAEALEFIDNLESREVARDLLISIDT